MEQKTHDISVIVTVYNTEAYLPACIESVLAQTFPDYELILVDDGSTDRSGEICERYAAQDERIRVIHQSNQGLMMARGVGARAARGEYLMFLDSDDTIEPVMLLHLARERKGNGIREIICCNYVIDREWNDTHERRKSAAAPGEYTGERLEQEIRRKLLGNEDRTVILSMCMKLFSRSLILENLHYYDPRIRMGEDVCRTVPALLDAERVVILQDAYDYHYRFVGDSMVHHYDPSLYDNMKRVRDILEQVVEDRNRQDLLPCVHREYFYFLLLTMKNEIRRTGVSFRAVADRIQRECRAEDAPSLASSMPRPSDPANRLLAWMMRRPGRTRIRIVRYVFHLADRRRS